MRTLQNTLYITTPNSYVRLQTDTLRIEVDREKVLQVPLHHIGSIVCLGDILVTSAVIHRCASDGRSIVMLDRNGRFQARIEGPVSGNVLLRKEQYRLSGDTPSILKIAQAFVAGKLRNTRQVLLRGARETSEIDRSGELDVGATKLADSLRRLPDAGTIDEVRGIEGEAARNYFACQPALLRPQLREAFSMNGRTRRPPRDPYNALISFLYSMLMNDCRSALEGVGLDPQVGFLHTLRPGRAALALDMMEEFRFLMDRLALSLINRGQINASDFVERDGSQFVLEDKARKTVITAFQERKQEETSHPLLEEKVPIGLLPHIQARLLARTIRGDTEGYLPFLYR